MNLAKPYNRPEFLDFLKEFLPDFEKDIAPIKLVHNFKTISGATYLGRSDSLDVDIYEFETIGKSQKKVSQAIESFKVAKQQMSFKSLVAYQGDDDDNWRFAFLQMSPDLNESGKIVTKISNPRRYSFILGPSAKIKTPEKYLIKYGRVNSFEELLKRFSIEVVNKEFYNAIAKLYGDLIGSKINKPKLKLPSQIDDSNIVKEFAVRLIGRTVFCWFLKQKESPKGQLIPDDILSSSAISCNENYYHSKIEPLFFEALNQPMDSRTERYQNGIWSLVPYLNGGLFAAQEEDFYSLDSNGFSKFVNNLYIDNGWFVEFFNILELYNFTIDENTLTDQELSVDPEMLGRIFENLLAEINPETGESARKATGSFYTPREIVDFMVDQSLIQYLKDKTKITEQKIKALVSEDIEDDKENPLTTDEITLIVNSLNELKVLDPACGSGAFPIGILQRILMVLQRIDKDGHLWFDCKITDLPDQMMRNLIKEKFEDEKLDYVRKLGLIKDSIFGVDIQPIAVEVAKLRCFLTLVVEETIDDTKQNRGIETLPNLDFKFVCANTLISTPDSRNGGMNFDESFQVEMAHAVDSYFQPRSITEKFNALNKLHELVDKKVEEKTKTAMSYLGVYQDEKFSKEYTKKKSREIGSSLSDANLWKSYKNIFKHKSAGFFDTKYFFPSIKDGFDVVIGNPPYIQLQDSKKISKEMQALYSEQKYQTFSRTADIYCLFYERGINLLKNDGVLIYITSNKWMRAGYGEKLRQYFLTFNPVVLVDLGPGVFETATVDTNIITIKKSKNIKPLKAIVLRKNQNKNISMALDNNGIDLFNLGISPWFIGSSDELALKEKIEKIGKPLKDWGVKINRGILTGLNEAFIIDQLTRTRLIQEDQKSSEIIKPILRGRDIHKYIYNFADLYLLQTGSDLNVPETYPAVYKHLLQFEEKAKKRDDQGKNWYNLRACVYYDDFEKEKLVWQEMSQEPCFSYDNRGVYCNDTGRILTGEHIKFFVGLFNTLFFKFTFSSYYAGGGLGAKGIRYKSDFMKKYPIPSINSSNSSIVSNIELLVDQIINAKKSNKDTDTTLLEHQINEFVYKYYDLTTDEIKTIEESVI